MVPPASRQVPRVRRYSGYCLLLVAFTYGTITLFGLASQPILLATYNGLYSPQPRLERNGAIEELRMEMAAEGALEKLVAKVLK